ncbi:MAG: N-acetylneuraminate synthase family protein [Vicingaceae bacterium]
MYIDKEVDKFLMHKDNSVLDALKKIESTHGRIVFIVSDKNKLEGVVTNGDIIRWLVQSETPNLFANIMEMANKNFIFSNKNEDASSIAKKLEKVLFIPLVDEDMHLFAVASSHSPKEGFKIDNFQIGPNAPAFIISEIGNNHNGDIEIAKQLVDASIEAGADCAKFQMRQLKHLYHNAGDSNDASENLGSQYTLDLLSKFQLTNEQLFEMFDYCKEKGILPLCTPWDLVSLQLLEDYGMPAYKIASADFTNLELLAAVAKTGKVMICSTGMSTENEIKSIASFLEERGAAFIFLHCNSTYPAPFNDINLNYMNKIQDMANGIVGYSGHERGISVSIAAVAMGAKVIERHITLDKSMEGNDHKASLLPHEFKEMVKGIKEVEESLGSGESRELSQGEMMNRVSLAKSIIAEKPINKGEIIQEEMLSIKSPGKGLQPMYLEELIGTEAKRSFQAGDFFYPRDIEDEIVEAREYKFNRPWGIPVRYHDFDKLANKTNLSLVEFHLSYKDLDLDLSSFFDREYELDFVVHSPELFANDHTLDLCSLDENYRKNSIKELQRVIDITKKINTYFPSTKKPLIVTNVGGFTSDGFLNKNERTERYKLLLESLNQLNQEGVEIIPQTMPPFPWHFGGQQYHNLFVHADEIVEFCKKNNYRICLDTSHSKLATNYYQESFYQFMEKTAEYSAHYHFADSKGTGGEGLQINDGEIDFISIAKVINEKSPTSSFIPEIWQGHENGGEGGWIALERLEAIL